MKKNYFAQLQQYDARTSYISKRDKYCRKFINTCYDDNNKENINPNLSLKIKSKNKQITSNKKKNKPLGRLQINNIIYHKDNHQSLPPNHRSSNKNKKLIFQPVSNQLQDSHFSSSNTSKASKQESFIKNVQNKRQQTFEEGDYSQNVGQSNMINMINEMSDLKIKCINIQRKIGQKQGQQSQKCKEYYCMLINEIKHAQKASLLKLHHHFQKCHQIIQSKISQITSIIQKLSLNLYQKDFNIQQNLIEKQLNKQISIQLLLVHVNKQSQSIIKKKINELNLFNLHQLFKSLEDDKKEVSTIKTTNNSLDDQRFLFCNEQLGNDGKYKKFPLNISFQKENNLFQNQKIPLIIQLSQESQGISPSFKIF